MKPTGKRKKKSSAERLALKEWEANERSTIARRLREGAPDRGLNPLEFHEEEVQEDGTVRLSTAQRFASLPISRRTLEALNTLHFDTLTPIQRAALPHALCGRDILGAAPTGSGKSLAFIIPVLESLYARHSPDGAVGAHAVILAPLRELAIQLFEVLARVGCNHDVSAMLVIGGKPIAAETQGLLAARVIVATPGRLLQHLDQTPGASEHVAASEMLVLDEADRLLELGFRSQLDAILQHLGPRPLGSPNGTRRQSLLFSATMSRDVSSLARLSLHRPEFLSVLSRERATAPRPVEGDAEQGGSNEEGTGDRTVAGAMPSQLQHAAVLVGIGEKMNTLYSLVLSKPRAKIIAFFATRKQARYAEQLFNFAELPMPVFSLVGNSKQAKRTGAYVGFCAARFGLLCTTDVASRGLDFPAVDVVVQVDAPDTRETYVHRAGRTARYTAGGVAIIFLTPEEAPPYLAELREGGLEVQESMANPRRMSTLTQIASAYAASSPYAKAAAQRAVQSFVRSLAQRRGKKKVDMATFDVSAFAQSLGLAGEATVVAAGGQHSREKAKAKSMSNELRNLQEGRTIVPLGLDEEALVEGDDGRVGYRVPTGRADRMLKRRNQTVFSEGYRQRNEDGESSEDVDELLVPTKGEAAHVAFEAAARAGAANKRRKVVADMEASALALLTDD